MPLLSVIIPVFNEESNIPLLYERLTQTISVLGELDYELIFINDSSTDNSLPLISSLRSKDKRINIIDLSRNFGHQAAISAGIDYCNGDLAVIIDADLQDPPELINEMYQKWTQGYEVVYAKRKTREGEHFLKKLTAKWFYVILKKITAIDIPIDTGDFRLIDRKVVDSIREMRENHRFMRGMVSWVGFKQIFVEFDRQERVSGKSNYTVRKLMHLALDGITSFSLFPLQLASWLGFVISLSSFIMIIYVLLEKYVFHTAKLVGWASIMVTILFLGGIQLLCIGIMGEYLGRIGNDVKKRPIYVVRTNTLSNNNGTT